MCLGTYSKKMLSKLRVQHYKSLYDTEVDLEPLTVFIGPNGSGKSNICEALTVLSNFLQKLIADNNNTETVMVLFPQSFQAISKNKQSIKSKFWQGKLDNLYFEVSIYPVKKSINDKIIESKEKLIVNFNYHQKQVLIRYKDDSYNLINAKEGAEDSYSNKLKNYLIYSQYLDSDLANSFKLVKIYDFSPSDLSSQVKNSSTIVMDRTGEGIAYSLVDILHANRHNFDELEARLTRLVPNIARISLPRKENQTFALELIDKYSEHHIPASDISDGTLRILAFLVALYQEQTPSIICFEELENGVHPWLLHKMMELLKIVSTEGINGNPVQVLITTHSPVLLNYVEPHQVRAVELDDEGKTQIHSLPTDSVRFQKALEAYDGELGELWFTNVFGANPV